MLLLKLLLLLLLQHLQGVLLSCLRHSRGEFEGRSRARRRLQADLPWRPCLRTVGSIAYNQPPAEQVKPTSVTTM